MSPPSLRVASGIDGKKLILPLRRRDRRTRRHHALARRRPVLPAPARQERLDADVVEVRDPDARSSPSSREIWPAPAPGGTGGSASTSPVLEDPHRERLAAGVVVEQHAVGGPGDRGGDLHPPADADQRARRQLHRRAVHRQERPLQRSARSSTGLPSLPISAADRTSSFSTPRRAPARAARTRRRAARSGGSGRTVGPRHSRLLRFDLEVCRAVSEGTTPAAMLTRSDASAACGRTSRAPRPPRRPSLGIGPAGSKSPPASTFAPGRPACTSRDSSQCCGSE